MISPPMRIRIIVLEPFVNPLQPRLQFTLTAKPQPNLAAVVAVQSDFLSVPSNPSGADTPSLDALKLPVLFHWEFPRAVRIRSNLFEHDPVPREFFLLDVNELLEGFDVKEAKLLDLHSLSNIARSDDPRENAIVLLDREIQRHLDRGV